MSSSPIWLCGRGLTWGFSYPDIISVRGTDTSLGHTRWGALQLISVSYLHFPLRLYALVRYSTSFIMILWRSTSRFIVLCDCTAQCVTVHLIALFVFRYMSFVIHCYLITALLLCMNERSLLESLYYFHRPQQTHIILTQFILLSL